jgi:hypothetical protein
MNTVKELLGPAFEYAEVYNIPASGDLYQFSTGDDGRAAFRLSQPTPGIYVDFEGAAKVIVAFKSYRIVVDLTASGPLYFGEEIVIAGVELPHRGTVKVKVVNQPPK